MRKTVRVRRERIVRISQTDAGDGDDDHGLGKELRFFGAGNKGMYGWTHSVKSQTFKEPDYQL